MYDLMVRGGTVVTAAEATLLDIGIEGEQIVEIARPGLMQSEARRVVHAAGCFVLPGGVDPHCHYNMTFMGVQSETQEYSYAAALGGTTTVIDFAPQIPPASLAEAIRTKKQEADGRMAVDYGLHALLTGEISFEVMEEIGDVIRDGIPTIKTMMTYDWMSDDGHRLGVMQQVAEHGGLSVVHAEDDAIARWLTKKYLRDGKTHGGYISETRGPLVEEAAIRRVQLLAERTGSPLYILHMAAGSGVAALDEARRRGLPFYGETLTPYLSFTAEKLWDDANRGLLWNNYPTIKYQEDQDELWSAITSDRLQVVSSDHFALTTTDRYKKLGTTVDSLQCGQAGVELRIPVLFHLGVQLGRLSVSRFVELIATNPAKIMGLYPQKGAIAIGSDADIVVYDPNRAWTVHHQDLHMNVDYSCWEDWDLRGKPRTTILRGQILVEDERFVGPKNSGRFIARALLPEVVANPRQLEFTSESSASVVDPG
jgi:dihydropyrimidinase